MEEKGKSNLGIVFWKAPIRLVPERSIYEPQWIPTNIQILTEMKEVPELSSGELWRKLSTDYDHPVHVQCTYAEN